MYNEPQSQSRQDDNKMQSRGIKDNKIVPKTREKYAARKEISSQRGIFFLGKWLLHIFKYLFKMLKRVQDLSNNWEFF